MQNQQTFKFFIPTEVVWGRGISTQTGELLQKFNPHKVLIVTDKGVRTAGLLEGIEKSLHGQELVYEIFDEVEPNPSAETVQKGLEFLKANVCNVVLSVGGGSSIDTAKAIAALAANPGHILEYEGVGKLKHPSIPHIAIPTTAGTGSEGTNSTVITNKETQFKTAVLSPYIFPTMAILDPVLTLHLPQTITAATGMDALTHAIESYTSKAATPFSQSLAIHAVRIIGQHLRNAYFVGTDIESREQMLLASLMAGIAFAHSRLGNVHAISHTFGGVFNVPHGIANATLLPFVMKYNLPACTQGYADIAQALGMEAKAENAIDWVLTINEEINIPNNIKDLGVSMDHLPKLVEDAMRSGNVLVNPRLTRSADIERIILSAYNGTI
jgi:alcohol dehydrogenase class IV